MVISSNSSPPPPPLLLLVPPHTHCLRTTYSMPPPNISKCITMASTNQQSYSTLILPGQSDSFVRGAGGPRKGSPGKSQPSAGGGTIHGSPHIQFFGTLSLAFQYTFQWPICCSQGLFLTVWNLFLPSDLQSTSPIPGVASHILFLCCAVMPPTIYRSPSGKQEPSSLVSSPYQKKRHFKLCKPQKPGGYLGLFLTLEFRVLLTCDCPTRHIGAENIENGGRPRPPRLELREVVLFRGFPTL